MVTRDMQGFAFSPTITAEERAKVEALVKAAVNTEALKGTYSDISALTESQTQDLIDDRLLFQRGDRYAEPQHTNHIDPSIELC